MSEYKWVERAGGVLEVDGLGMAVQVRWAHSGEGYQWWCLGGGGGVCDTQAKAQIAALGVYRAQLQGQLDGVSALLNAIKQAAQDADDAALVATIGGEVWTARDAGWAVLHTAQVAGHRCLVSVSPDGRVKWEIEPEHYGHPYTWDAPDLETAKIRAAAAALREPCKRWRVTLPPQRQIGRRIEGGEVEVWAMSEEGALYRAAQALGAGFIGGGSIEGEALEVAR